MKPGTLYLVATPIGNLEDLTFRASRILKEVDVIACEDTRHTRGLLEAHGIRTPLVSYHEHNEQRRARELIGRLLAGESVALVSDAGTPVLSDPGYTILRAAIEQKIPTVPIPGPSAITTALVISGLPPDRFLFGGFLPRRSAERRRALAGVAAFPWTLVFFETPHRIGSALEDVRAVLGDRRLALVRELTKRFEEIIRGTTSEVLAYVKSTPPKGELTMVIEGADENKIALTPSEDAVTQLKHLLASGSSPKDAVKAVAQTHRLPRRAVYQLALNVMGKRG
jgi:16S rRNA (cytidine1402-2'-O)-methyltransferase